jgi:hypothetical protein
MKPTAFLNLDLELRAKSDLASLAKYLGEHASLLHCGKFGDDYQLTAEPLCGGHSNHSVQACTEELLETIVALPGELKELFDRSHVRLFDYGFDGGLSAKPLSVDVSAAQLLRMAQLGIGPRVTVYPYRAELPGTDQAETRD